MNRTMRDMRVGEKSRVVCVKNCGTMRRRLSDLGLITGTEIECVQRSPFGDPMAYLIRGAVIALRACDSKKIYIA